MAPRIKDLTQEEMLDIIEKAAMVLGEFFVHLTQKRARYGFDPLTALGVLRNRIDNEPKDSTPTVHFHNEMRLIFSRLKDNHTRYFVTGMNEWAELPFIIEKCYDKSKDPHEDHYLVTAIAKDAEMKSPDDNFASGVEVTHWNGVPIKKAIRLNAENCWGANRAAFLAQGLNYLTQRHLEVSENPLEEWVEIGYIARKGGEKYEDFWKRINKYKGTRNTPIQFVRFRWQLRNEPITSDSYNFSRRGARRLALDRVLDCAQRSQERIVKEQRKLGRQEKAIVTERHKALDAILEEGQRAPLEDFLQQQVLRRYQPASWFSIDHSESRTKKRRSRTSVEIQNKLKNDFLTNPNCESPFIEWGTYHSVKTGTLYGVMRIYKLVVPHYQTGGQVEKMSDAELQNMYREILSKLNSTTQGLIIDIRGNPGGDILAPELLLQLLTEAPIAPTSFQFRYSNSLQMMVEGKQALLDWRKSLIEAATYGAEYSQAFPLPHEEKLLGEGKCEYKNKPIVLITDALCYSAADVFAAGFKDKDIGEIIGVDPRTGAGGANVWSFATLREYLNSILEIPFPKGSNPGSNSKPYLETELGAALPAIDDIDWAQYEICDPITGYLGNNVEWHIRKKQQEETEYIACFHPEKSKDRVFVVACNGWERLSTLPKGVDIEFSIRRALRTGARMGLPLEDVGVSPTLPYGMTAKDILQKNEDLLEHAAQHLEGQKSRRDNIKYENSGLMIKKLEPTEMARAIVKDSYGNIIDIKELGSQPLAIGHKADHVEIEFYPTGKEATVLDKVVINANNGELLTGGDTPPRIASLVDGRRRA